ncbi:putative homing endonuclease RB16 4 [Escherichia phage RB16]|uniref:RB16 HNH(AP2) 4 n=2 Tax=Pseudotevenvirus RB16 TaxID=329381 RepID=Q4TZU9_9CAUD|nr:putative homing endonuclease RB16 4 [Escherichia phage RB16]AAY44389.1 RB16 HNH(AP2) 4 [Pseudotevenvirus RB16]ADJ55390.1 putative homing endonuclease RB16 4 [Escherichia phage RB16]
MKLKKQLRTLDEETQGIENLLQCIRVEPETGKCFWLEKRSNKIPAGSEAGSFHKSSGYTRIKFENAMYIRSRVIFYYVNGYLPVMVDHVHGVECGDMISNLRESNQVTNQQNRTRNKNNTVGFKGVSFNKKSQKYSAKITLHGVTKWLGFYDSAEEASEAYKAKALVSFTHNERYLNDLTDSE